MPGTTTNFGIRYPCSGETINPTVFANWADDIDAALTDVSTLTTEVLHRPRASVKTVDAGTSTAVGALTTLNVGDVTLYADGVTVTPTGFITNEPTLEVGVWMVTAEFSPLNSVTTLTSWAGGCVTSPGDDMGRKMGISGANTLATNINISGLLRVVSPSIISFNWLWTGTGGPMFVYCNASISKIV